MEGGRGPGTLSPAALGFLGRVRQRVGWGLLGRGSWDGTLGASVALWGALWGALKGTAPPSAPPPLRDTTTTSTPVRIQPTHDANVHLLPGRMGIGGSDGRVSIIEGGPLGYRTGGITVRRRSAQGPRHRRDEAWALSGPCSCSAAADSGRRRGGGDDSPRYLRYLVTKVSGALNRQRYFARAQKRSNSQSTDDESQDHAPDHIDLGLSLSQILIEWETPSRV